MEDQIANVNIKKAVRLIKLNLSNNKLNRSNCKIYLELKVDYNPAKAIIRIK